MKKYILAIALGMGFSMFASGQCLDMDAGKFCMNLRNLGNGTYSVEKTLQPKVIQNIYILNCRVLTPENKLVDLGQCKKNLTYSGTGKHPLKFYIELEGQKSIINMDYNFVRLSSTEANSITNIYNNWNNLSSRIASMYPVAGSNQNWKNLSNQFYTALDNLLYGKGGNLKSYNDVKNALVTFVQYTRSIK